MAAAADRGLSGHLTGIWLASLGGCELHANRGIVASPKKRTERATTFKSRGVIGSYVSCDTSSPPTAHPIHPLDAAKRHRARSFGDDHSPGSRTILRA